MFDYQAGEKYKLTLIMVGIAGLLAGIFFSMLLMPTEAPASRKRAQQTRAMSDPDVTGGRGYAPSQGIVNVIPTGGAPQPNVQLVDRGTARIWMDTWLPRVWDLGAQSAAQSQEWAIAQMTPECAAAYRQNIWTGALAKQVSESGLQSSFTPSVVDVSENHRDGSVEVKVQGVQVLGAAAGQKQRQIAVTYMLIQTPEGMRVAGISEGAK